MTDHDSQQPPSGGYDGPPRTEQYPAQYPQPYPAQPYPGHPQQPYGYPPNPYAQQPGFSPAGPRRPGLVIAASVMGYVNAGMIILAGALLLFGAAIVRDVEDAFDSGTDFGTEFAVLGIANLLAGGLLIGGAVAFTSGRSVGRIILVAGNALVLVLAVYWLVRFSDDRFGDGGDGRVVWGIVFGVIAVLSLAFSFTTDTNRWLAASRRT